ncbi:hypothetical protein [uncultured Polaribacter sp.]|uniref:hypothetical protein n=1 Tax=uncultured Polaribacter sp. TaxID=174711 RepID=UPI00262424D1|nr:hypothetical protein [uncultured Polaribacter sp.]
MKKELLIFLTILISNLSFSQHSETDTISKAKIKELNFIVGDWIGKGWMMGENGKSKFDQTEKIQFKLDSTAILIEGKGKSNGEVIHNALAILTYNKKDDNYVFRSFLPSGQNAKFKAELIDNKLYWYPNENVRYIIWQNENEQWLEKGEFKREGKWSQFFEMTLNRNDK